MIEQRVAVVLDDATFGDPVEVGTLCRDKGSGGEAFRFFYAETWLDRRTAFPFDPELPLHAGDFFSRVESGMFGAFRDTSPDRWGRVLMERREGVEARAEGRRPRRLSEWDFLLGVSTSRALARSGFAIWRAACSWTAAPSGLRHRLNFESCNRLRRPLIDPAARRRASTRRGFGSSLSREAASAGHARRRRSPSRTDLCGSPSSLANRTASM